MKKKIKLLKYEDLFNKIKKYYPDAHIFKGGIDGASIHIILKDGTKWFINKAMFELLGKHILVKKIPNDSVFSGRHFYTHSYGIWCFHEFWFENEYELEDELFEI